MYTLEIDTFGVADTDPSSGPVVALAFPEKPRQCRKSVYTWGSNQTDLPTPRRSCLA